MSLSAPPKKLPSIPKPKPYLLFVTDDCPFDVVHLGGVDFPKRTEILESDKNSGVTHRTTQRGIIKHLYPDDLEAIARFKETKFIRGRRIMSKLNKSYRPRHQDIAITKFVRMKELSEDDVFRMRPQTRIMSDDAYSEAELNEKAARLEAYDESLRKQQRLSKAMGLKAPGTPE